jgi:hypothetical protein
MLQVSGRHFRRLCAPEGRNDTPTAVQLRRVERWSAQLPGMLEQWRLESIATINAEAERRKLEIADGVTRLRAMRLAREASDKARVSARAAARLQKAAVAEARKAPAQGQGKRGGGRKAGIFEPRGTGES